MTKPLFTKVIHKKDVNVENPVDMCGKPTFSFDGKAGFCLVHHAFFIHMGVIHSFHSSLSLYVEMLEKIIAKKRNFLYFCGKKDGSYRVIWVKFKIAPTGSPP